MKEKETKIRFTVDRLQGETYGDYEPYTRYHANELIGIYLTYDFIGLDNTDVVSILGYVTHCSYNPLKKKFTTKEVEEHLNMAVLREVYRFLDGELHYD